MVYEDMLTDLATAHDEVASSIQSIPQAALDWQAQDGSSAWTLRQTASHLAHSNDFYITIVEEAAATGFGHVNMRPELAGLQRMAGTDAAVARVSPHNKCSIASSTAIITC